MTADDDFPPRLSERSDPHVKRLLEQVRRDGPPLDRVAATVAGVLVATGSGASASAARGALSPTLKIAFAVGAAGLVAVGTLLALRGDKHDSIATPIAATTTVVAQPAAPEPTLEPAPTAIAEPAPTETAPQPTPAIVKVTPRASSSADESSMSVELTRMLAIRRAMLDKNPAAALAGAEAYERDFPRGSFVPEAEAMAIEALSDLGRKDEAKTRAARFSSRYGNSPQAVRIRALQQRLE